MTKHDEATIIESAATAIEGVLTLQILPEHQRDSSIAGSGPITQAPGKYYTTRYQSTREKREGNEAAARARHD